MPTFMHESPPMRVALAVLLPFLGGLRTPILADRATRPLVGADTKRNRPTTPGLATGPGGEHLARLTSEQQTPQTETEKGRP